MTKPFTYLFLASILLTHTLSAFAADPLENYNAFTPAGREDPELEMQCRQELNLLEDTLPAATILYNLRRCISIKKAQLQEKSDALDTRSRRDRLIAKTVENATRIQNLLRTRVRKNVLLQGKKSISRLSARPDRATKQEIIDVRKNARLELLRKEEEKSEVLDMTRNFRYSIECAGLKRDERIQCIRQQISNVNIGGPDLK